VEATRGLNSDAEKARAIYEHIVGRMRYDKSGTGWGAWGRAVRLRGEAGQLHRLPRPGHRHGPLGRHPGPVRHRPAAAE
jgi:hypothetical protein